MDREKLDQWCERGILGLVLAILVYGPLATGAVQPRNFLILQGLTLAATALWCLRLWLDPRPKFLWPPVCWAVLAFALYAVARYFAADIEYIARQEMIRVFVYALVFFIILNNLHGQTAMQIMVVTLILLAMFIAGYAIIQFVTNSTRVWGMTTPYAHRGSGTYISPNNLAGFLELLIPLALACTLAGRGKPVMKILLGYASLVMLVGLVVTVSRGGWAATALSLMFFFGVLTFRRNHRWPALLFLVLIAGAAAFFIPKNFVFRARLEQLSNEAPKEHYSRFDVWRGAIEMWQDNRWLGVGPGHFDYRFRQYRPQTMQGHPNWTHNDYLNTLADWGVAGAALIAAAMALLAWGILKTWREAIRADADLGGKPSNKFALVLGASAAMIAIAVHSVVDFNMHIPANALVVVMLMAVLSAHLRFATDRFWFRNGLATKSLATLVLLAGMIYLGAQEFRGAREQYWLLGAAKAQEQSDERIALLKRAFAVDPQNPATAYDIGENYRMKSWSGAGDYEALAREAQPWFERVMKLNPYDPYGWLRFGMCEDWLKRHAEAWPYYEKALDREPNGYFVTAWVGWHYVQVGDFAAAKEWFERSVRLEWHDNTMAETFIPILNARLLEAATNTNPFHLLLQR